MVLYLSELIGKPILGPKGERVGRLKDLIVHIGKEPYPYLTGLVAVVEGQPGHRFFIPVSQATQLDNGGLRLENSRVNLSPFRRLDNELLLNKDVLDKQIVDINGRRVIRANDVELSQVGGGWRLAGVDVSAAALLNRLGIGFLASKTLQREVIPWDGVQFFASEVPNVKLQLGYDKLATLHPVDIAELVNQLSYQQGSEVLTSLDDELAADAVEEMEPEQQAAIISALDPDEAADILDEMEPDDVADLLADLPREQAEDLLEEMGAEEAADVKRLLAYDEDTAGGLMTTGYVAIPQMLTASQTLERLRAAEWVPDSLYLLYVLDQEPDGKLVGTISLRDLILAPPEQAVSEIMETQLIFAHADDSAEEAARLMAKYDLIALPILDESEHLCGIITVDDAIDVILPQDWKQRVPRIFS